MVRLYQFFHLSVSFLYCGLFVRWLILLPLVTSKYLPGGIHEYLCYLILYSSIGSLLWWVKSHGINRSIFDKSVLKNLNLVYFVSILHFHDDYEHAPVLKNTSYSSFIIGLSFIQMYHHWGKLFKYARSRTNNLWWKVNTFVMIPLCYLSEFYLLLLNTQNDNFHNGPKTVLFNKFVLVLFLPICLHLYMKLLSL